MESLGAEMNFMRDLAHAGKIAQGQFIARKKAMKGGTWQNAAATEG